MNKKPVILILVLIICSLFMPISINYVGQSKISNSSTLDRYVYLSKLDIVSSNSSNTGFTLTNYLGMEDGIKNGVVLSGNYFRNIITGTMISYKNGFTGKSSEMKMVWLFFGIFYVVLKNILLSSMDLILMIVILLSLGASSYVYILSYIITILFIVGIGYVLKKQ